jgi:hypothetical protein
MIAIVAPDDDESAKAVMAALERAGRRDVMLLDLEKAFETLTLSWHSDSLGSRWSVANHSPGAGTQRIDEQSLSAVWWRRPARSLDSAFFRYPQSGNLDAFEMFWSLHWLLESLPPSLFPLGHPHALAVAENKHLQLAAARQAGLCVPESCHSNDIAALMEFASSRTLLAVKALRLPAITPAGEYDWRTARPMACKSVSSSLLLGRLQSIKATQLFCQDAIQRKTDLRIVVLPGEIIAVEIDLSNLKNDVLDWRPGVAESAQRIVSVPPDLEQKLRQFLALMNLKSGHFDLAVPDFGPPVFFECNPNGQWDWIQKLTGHPIDDAMARALADPR